MNLLSDAEIDGMALDHEGCVYLTQAEWQKVSAQAKANRVGEPVAWVEQDDIPNIAAMSVFHRELGKPLVARRNDGKWFVHPPIAKLPDQPLNVIYAMTKAKYPQTVMQAEKMLDDVRREAKAAATESPAAERAELPEERITQAINACEDIGSRIYTGITVEAREGTRILAVAVFIEELRTALKSIIAQKDAEISDLTKSIDENWVQHQRIVTAERRVAELTAALKEQRTQMDYPYLPPAFAATMKRMIDAGIGKVKP